jgi:short-subunit dehydrogenase
MKTKNLTTLITGGLSGIGKAVAKKAAADNNHLILVQRRTDANFDNELKKLGAASVRQISLDLADLKNVDALVATLEKDSIEIDILFNNAGVLTGGVLEDQDAKKIENMLKVNLTSPILLTKKILPSMLKRKTGKIINNCSVTAKIPIPAASTYGASKAGLLHFTNCLRQELRGTGVSTLTLITPGVKTDMFDDIHQQYKKNIDTRFLTSITADEWAEQVWKAIEGDEHTLLPKGSERVGVFLSTYLPSLIEGRFDRYFQR